MRDTAPKTPSYRPCNKWKTWTEMATGRLSLQEHPKDRQNVLKRDINILLEDVLEIISKPLTFLSALPTGHKNPHSESTAHNHPPEPPPPCVHHLPHNIISLYFLYLCKNSPISFKYLKAGSHDPFLRI